MIGLYDSGVGGLSIWAEVARTFPDVDTIYVADQKHVPYGSKPFEEIRRLSSKIVEMLIAENAQVIVIASNTISGVMLSDFREMHPRIPFVGVEPAVKPAAENTRTQCIGVLATQATVKSDRYHSLLERYTDGLQVVTQACPGLVEYVETGSDAAHPVEALLSKYLDPMLRAPVDQLVLGCTHYHFLEKEIRSIVGEDMAILSSSVPVARQVGRILSKVNGCGKDGSPGRRGTHRYMTTGDLQDTRYHLDRLLGIDLSGLLSIEHVSID